jgi:hypothetical protein
MDSTGNPLADQVLAAYGAMRSAEGAEVKARQRTVDESSAFGKVLLHAKNCTAKERGDMPYSKWFTKYINSCFSQQTADKYIHIYEHIRDHPDVVYKTQKQVTDAINARNPEARKTRHNPPRSYSSRKKAALKGNAAKAAPVVPKPDKDGQPATIPFKDAQDAVREFAVDDAQDAVVLIDVDELVDNAVLDVDGDDIDATDGEDGWISPESACIRDLLFNIQTLTLPIENADNLAIFHQFFGHASAMYHQILHPSTEGDVHALTPDPATALTVEGLAAMLLRVLDEYLEPRQLSEKERSILRASAH